MLNIPYSLSQIKHYKERIIEKISKKIQKAKKGYDLNNELILAIYVNEYISLYFDKTVWEMLVIENKELFDNIAPFSEIIFTNLDKNNAFCVLSANANKGK